MTPGGNHLRSLRVRPAAAMIIAVPILEYRVMPQYGRMQPRIDYHFGRRVARWFLRVALVLALALAVGVLLTGVVHALQAYRGASLSYINDATDACFDHRPPAGARALTQNSGALVDGTTLSGRAGLRCSWEMSDGSFKTVTYVDQAAESARASAPLEIVGGLIATIVFLTGLVVTFRRPQQENTFDRDEIGIGIFAD